MWNRRSSLYIGALLFELVRTAIRDSIREQEFERVRQAYIAQPDSESEADDWSTCEEFQAWSGSKLEGDELACVAGKRPVLSWADITTTIRRIPVEVIWAARDRPGVCGELRFARSNIGKRIGWLQPSRHVEVKRAVGYALGWEELMGAL